MSVTKTKTNLDIKYVKQDKFKLPEDDFNVRLPKEFNQEIRDTHVFVEYTCMIKKFDSLNIYAQTGLMIPNEEKVNPAWCQNIGKQIQKMLAANSYSKGYVFVDQYLNKVPNNKKLLVHKILTSEEYAAKYLKITARCVYCEGAAVIKGNELFQNKLFQIPGSKNMTYACSAKCKGNFKDHMKSINGTTSKEVRKRYHKAMYTDVYGYVYGIYNKKEDKWYVGKVGRSPFARWEEHMMKNKILAGMPIEHLRFEILETIKVTGVGDADIETLWNAECKWIGRFDSFENGYNIQMPTKYLKRDTIGMEDITDDELYRKIVGIDRED